MGKKNIFIFYEFIKGILVILLSLVLFNVFDLSNLITIIPNGNISINITFYGAILTFIISMAESKIKTKRVKIDAKVVRQKSKFLSCKTPIVVNKKYAEDIYIIISVSGSNKEKLNNKKIVVKFPNSVTIQPESRPFLMNRNGLNDYEIHVDLSELSKFSGTNGIPVSLLKEKPTKFIIEAEISPELKLAWWEHLFIDFNYEETTLIITDE